MIAATQMKVGNLIMHNGKPHRVTAVVHRTPGNLRGFVQATLVNIENGSKNEHRFSSEDKVERATLEEHSLQFSYRAGDQFHFMNTESYEQTHISREVLGGAVDYLTPNLQLQVEFYEGKPIGIELPATVDLEVVATEPGLKSATASSVMKPAKTETGLVVQVPPFINEGEKIRVDTAEGVYLERVKAS